MKLKNVFALMIVLSLFTAAAFADAASAALSVRAFQFRYKQAENAAIVIKPLVSAGGSFSIQPSSNTLIVTDRAENLKNIAVAVAQYDKPARGVKIDIRLVAASRQVSPAKVPDDLLELSTKLSGILRFNSFEKLGQIVAEGKEGDPVITNVDGVYRAEFKIGEYDPLSDTIRVGDFQLSRMQPGGNGQLTPLLKTSLNLKVGQTVILGASRMPDSQRALMLVLVAKSVN
jgi:Type II secretory pathway, component PulD